jgi:hypothetical protein
VGAPWTASVWSAGFRGSELFCRSEFPTSHHFGPLRCIVGPVSACVNAEIAKAFGPSAGPGERIAAQGLSWNASPRDGSRPMRPDGLLWTLSPRDGPEGPAPGVWTPRCGLSVHATGLSMPSDALRPSSVVPESTDVRTSPVPGPWTNRGGLSVHERARQSRPTRFDPPAWTLSPRTRLGVPSGSQQHATLG